MILYVNLAKLNGRTTAPCGKIFVGHRSVRLKEVSVLWDIYVRRLYCISITDYSCDNEALKLSKNQRLHKIGVVSDINIF